MEYRIASEKDIPFITEVYNENLESLHGVYRDEGRWQELLSDKSCAYYIVCKECPVAWFRLEAEDGLLWLGMLQVKPAFQGKGVGKYVLSVFEAIAREQGYAKVGIHTTEDNAAARGLYAWAGYAVTEIGPCTTADGIDRVGYTFQKEL